MSTSKPPTLTVRNDRVRPLQCGHPWVFAGALVSASPPEDDLVALVSEDGDELGFGLWSATSNLRVRRIDPEICPAGRLGTEEIARALDRAADRRRTMGIASEATNIVRLFNSEGDGLPGLVVDRLGDLVVMQLTTGPLAQRRALVVDAIREALAPAHLLEVPAPPAIARIEELEEVSRWHGDELGTFEARENGVIYSIDPAVLQKTGHYADMREHRKWVGSVAAGRTVLDAFSYTGGFGLNAARGGAARVVCVDSSPGATAALERNITLNGFDSIIARRARVEDFMRSATDRGEQWQIVVLDPPKLAPRKADLRKALKAYTRLMTHAMRVLAPDGLLAVGSCSGAIGLPELARALANATSKEGRPMSVVYSGSQPSDHPYPASMNEGRYLTFLAAWG